MAWTILCAAAATVQGHQTLWYAGSSASLTNPERGFRSELDDFPAMQHLEAATSQFNLTLAQVYSYMWQFCTTSPCRPLSSQYLAELDDGFARARAVGVKLLVRFCYENSSATPANGPSTFEEIFRHMRQLQPVVARNADVIHTIAAGFVGAYGEWHSSVHHLEDNHSALALLVQHELDWFLPHDKSVIIRTPAQKANLLRTWPRQSTQAKAAVPNFGWCVAGETVNRSQACMRLGFDNDGFGAGDTDGGTWQTVYTPYGAMDNTTGVELSYNLPGNPEYDYMTRESPYLLIDGEPYAHNKGCRSSLGPQPGCTCSRQPMCTRGVSGKSTTANVVLTHEAGSEATVRLRRHHYTSFSFSRNCEYLRAEGKTCSPSTGLALDYWRSSIMSPAIIDQWNLPHSSAYPMYTTSYLQYLTDHLGYRIELASSTVPSAAIAVGGALTFNCTFFNRGFASIINPRDVIAVLVKENDDALIMLGPIETDVRTWQPYVPGDPYFYAIEHTLAFHIAALPSTVTAGTYRLGLYLPDPRAKAHGSQARFAIRFANDDPNFEWWTAEGNSSTAPRRYGVNAFARVDVV